MTGRTVIVTGANSGIGRRRLRARGRRRSHVLAVRNTDKGKAAAATMPGSTEVRELDLASLASIRRFAEAWAGEIAILINNAGVMIPPLTRTADGFELQFGTNHLGHFALTNLLLEHVSGRVVTVSSSLHKAAGSTRRPQLGAQALQAQPGLRTIQAREPSVHLRAPAPPHRGGIARTGDGSPPRLRGNQPAGPEQQPPVEPPRGNRESHRRTG